MTLPNGLRLGPYEIVAPLGAGGMGEVYRARDTRLQRTVAVKVMPEGAASTPDALRRFEREARAISRLNHPHICALYDVGRHEGRDYLVLELLEGETLADRLVRGALPLEQALRIGVEIADALGAAHRHGIVHRDLKPGNIMLTRAGVKLLDFGLAKPLAATAGTGDAGAGAADLTSLSTRTRLTQQGIVLGTLPYMAPEQVEGQDTDARTDIFALGAILYEMATGRMAFEGKSQASLTAAILEREPVPIVDLRPGTPSSFDHLVRTCLAKRPDDRWQNADDIGRALSFIERSGREERGTAAPRSGVMAAAGGLLLAGILLGWFGGWLREALLGRPAVSAAAAITRRFSIVLPDSAPLAPPSATPFGYLRASMAVSPDDSLIAYVAAAEGGQTRIFMRRADRFDPEPIPGTEGGFDPFFSPDGRWLGFFTFDSVRKVAIDGGAPLTLAAVVNPVGGTWCDDGTIYVAGEEGYSLWRVDGSGTSRREQAVPVPLGDRAPYSYPNCLPGGRALLLTVFDRQPDEPAVGVLVLGEKDARPHRLLARGYAPQYAAGRIVFARSGSLMTAPFDPVRLTITGPETAALGGVSMCSVAIPAAQYALSSHGSLLYLSGVDQARTRLVWIDRQGRVSPTAAAPELFGTVRLSPDGRRALVEVGAVQDDVYVYDLTDGRRIRITSDGKSGRRGMWHPDGRRAIFFSEADHRWVIKPVESDVAPEPLEKVDGFFTSWSAAGTLAGERDGRIWIGTFDRQTTVTASGNEWGAAVSPDGRRLAYTSSRTGSYQVFAQPIPPTGHEWQLSSDFGEEPVWSSDSRELFFRRHSQWWSVPFATGEPGPPRLLFQGAYFNALGPSYDVAPDGRFVMALPPASGPVRELQWIEGWTASLSVRQPPSD
jgi:serine/threonine-protein kinase